MIASRGSSKSKHSDYLARSRSSQESKHSECPRPGGLDPAGVPRTPMFVEPSSLFQVFQVHAFWVPKVPGAVFLMWGTCSSVQVVCRNVVLMVHRCCLLPCPDVLVAMSCPGVLLPCHVQRCSCHHAMSRSVFDCVCAVFGSCCAVLVVSVVLLPHGRWGRQHA